MITLQSVCAGYGGKPVLSDIALEARRGDFIALIGPNGSGKSTLLKVMAGQMPPSAGAVLLRGKPIEDYTPRQRGQLVAFFPQSRPVPDMDVRTMVSHGRFPRLGFGRVMGKDDAEAVEAAIAQAGLAGFEGRLLSSLSGGERQRAYLAMLISQEADILLLDEPGSFLDIRHQMEMMDILQKLNARGKTVIFAAHDLPLAFSYAGRIVLLSGGALAADGTPESMAAGSAVANAFGVGLKPQDAKSLFKFTLVRPE